MSVLVIAEHDNAALRGSTLNTIGAASKIGGDVTVLVAGSGCRAVAEAAAAVEGVSRVLLADDPSLENPLAENLEIGRASCRARVCWSVVYESLNTKTLREFS